jgi:dynein heavy chain
VGLVTEATRRHGELPPLESEDADAQAEGESDPSRETARYLYYMMNGIDTEQISSLEAAWVANTLRRIKPELLRRSPAVLERLQDEMAEDHVTAMKKSIVDFVLRDQQAQDSGSQTWPAFAANPELDSHEKAWTVATRQASAKLGQELYLLSPGLATLLPAWAMEFSHTHLIKPEELCRKKAAFDAASFSKSVAFQIDRARHALQRDWVQKLAGHFDALKARGLLPEARNPRYWACCATVMSAQLRSLLLASLEAFVDLLFPAPGSFSMFRGFGLLLQVQDKALGFDLNVDDVETVVLNLLNKMVCGHTRACSPP